MSSSYTRGLFRRISEMTSAKFKSYLPVLLQQPGVELFRRGGFDQFELIQQDGETIVQIQVDDHLGVNKHRVRFESPYTPRDAECSCKDFKNRGVCSHQACAAQVLWHVVHPQQWDPAITPLAKSKIAQFIAQLSDPQDDTDSNSNSDSSHRPRLEAILYCPHRLLPNQIENLPGARKINPGKKPRTDELAESVYPEHYRDPASPPLFPNYSPAGACLQYLFSDGTLLYADEILRHAYSKLPLPRSILPFLGERRLLHELSEELTCMYTGQDDAGARDLDHSFILIFEEAARIAAKHSIQIFLGAGQDRHAQRPFIPIRSIAVQRGGKHPLELRLHCTRTAGKTELGFSCKFEKGERFFPSFYLNMEKGLLTFHQEAHRIRKLYEMAQVFGLADPVLRESSNDPAVLQAALVILGHAPAQTHLELAPKFFKETESTLRVTPQSVVIPFEKITPVLHVYENGAIKFGFRATTEDKKLLWVFNLPSGAKFLMQAFQDGIRHTLTAGTDPKELAHPRQSQRRERDLKVLSHSGMFVYLYQKTAEAFIAGKTKAELLEDIFQGLAMLLKDWEGIKNSTENHLKFMVSRPVLDAIENTINLIEKEIFDTLDVFLPEGRYQLQGAQKHVARLLLALIEKSAIKTEGECFRRARTHPFPEFFSEEGSHDADLIARFDEESARCLASAKGYHSGFDIHELSDLRNFGFELFFEDRPLEEMNVNEFVPDFEMREEPGAGGANNIDWFELHPRFFFKGEEVNLGSAQRLAKDGIIEFQGKYFILKDRKVPSIKRLEKFWERLGLAVGGDGTGKKKGEKKAPKFVRLARSQTLEMLALKAAGVPVRGTAAWEEIVQFYESLTLERKPIPIPETTRAELKEYQKWGVTWVHDIYKLRLGGILADDMGLGKTLQTLCFLDLLRSRKDLGKCLIVVPTSLTYNWIAECEKFTPEIKISRFNSKSKVETIEFLKKNEQAVLVTTYGLLIEHEEFFNNMDWNIHIYDEAQSIKNLSAKRTSAARRIKAKFKLCLSGTPLENHPGELFSLMDIAVPGSLGEWKEFRSRYLQSETIAIEDIRDLKLRIKPLVLRRTKSEILKELPPKTETQVKLEFDEQQKKIYRDIALSWNEKVRESVLRVGEAQSQVIMLTALLRLRQVCSDPAAVPNVEYHGTPPKISLLCDALKSITESGESAVVFTQFIHTFDRIKGDLAKEGIACYSLSGRSSRQEREKALQGFQECKKGAVMLMTLKTGGVGLNLVKAAYVFHLEPWWNPAVENQATDRTYRIGQTRPVQVYRYIMRESVEEKIEVLKSRKAKTFDAVFLETEEAQGHIPSHVVLTQQDFSYLLSPGS